MNQLKKISRHFNLIKIDYFTKCKFKQRTVKVPLKKAHQIIKFFTITSFSTSLIIPQGKINVEDDLREAIHSGEDALINLMKNLENLVIEASKEYRECLMMEIELIKQTGDSASEELPKYRTTAKHLQDELYQYIIVLKTIGELLVYNEAEFLVTMNEESIEKILKVYDKLEILLLKEYQLNKLRELELLEVVIDNIAYYE